MGALDIATAALGVLGIVTKGVSDAIAAAMEKKEDEAFDILERTLSETATSLASMRAKLAANKAAAEQALVDKFGSKQP